MPTSTPCLVGASNPQAFRTPRGARRRPALPSLSGDPFPGLRHCIFKRPAALHREGFLTGDCELSFLIREDGLKTPGARPPGPGPALPSRTFTLELAVAQNWMTRTHCTATAMPMMASIPSSSRSTLRRGESLTGGFPRLSPVSTGHGGMPGWRRSALEEGPRNDVQDRRCIEYLSHLQIQDFSFFALRPRRAPLSSLSRSSCCIPRRPRRPSASTLHPCPRPLVETGETPPPLPWGGARRVTRQPLSAEVSEGLPHTFFARASRDRGSSAAGWAPLQSLRPQVCVRFETVSGRGREGIGGVTVPYAALGGPFSGGGWVTWANVGPSSSPPSEFAGPSIHFWAAPPFPNPTPTWSFIDCPPPCLA